MQRRGGPVVLPELFLGLLAIGVAVVVTAHIVAGTIHDVRHSRDTLSVTASGRVPISANLARWSLTVSPQGPTPARAAHRLRRESAYVRNFLRKAGIAADAISLSVVRKDVIVTKLPHRRVRTSYVVSQQLEVSTRKIDVLESVATRVGELLEQRIDVSASPIQYLSTELTKAKLDALEKLGRMRSSSQGVFQVTPRDSTDVSDYGINDTSSREKDVNAVVSATFDVIG